MEFSNTTLLYGLFNQYVFSEAKMNIHYVKLYYKQKYGYGINSLITRLINLIEEYNYLDLTESRFLLTFQSDGKTLEESQAIYDKIKEFRSYNREQSSVFIDNLRSICGTAFRKDVEFRYGEDSARYLEEIKKYSYKSNYSQDFVMKNFADLDITDLINRVTVGGAKSRYKAINDSFDCGQYPGGILVVVAGAPSTGKSLFLQGEIVNFILQGKRVHYLVMGDLSELNVAQRLISQATKKSHKKISSDILGQYETHKGLFKRNLTITVLPSGKITAREYVDAIMEHIDEFDIFVVDYDSNFAGNEIEESLYDKGGITYDAMTEITREGKLVMIASQVNKESVSKEKINMGGLAESSRKMQITDYMITIGRNDKASIPMGVINIAKNRHGEQGEFYWVRTSDGLFYVPSEGLYRKLLQGSSKYIYTYDEYANMDTINVSTEEEYKSTLEEKK